MTHQNVTIRFAAIFNGNCLDAFVEASSFQENMGGRILTLPKIIDHEIADRKYEILNPWIYLTPNSQECKGKTRGGKDVIAVIHGDGPISPTIQYRKNDIKDGLRVFPKYVFHNLLQGKIGDDKVPVLTYDDVVKNEVPERCIIVLDAEKVNEDPYYNSMIFEATKNRCFVSRVGGWERAVKYLEKIQEKFPNRDTFRNVRPIFNNLDRPSGYFLAVNTSSLGSVDIIKYDSDNFKFIVTK